MWTDLHVGTHELWNAFSFFLSLLIFYFFYSGKTHLLSNGIGNKVGGFDRKASEWDPKTSQPNTKKNKFEIRSDLI